MLSLRVGCGGPVCGWGGDTSSEESMGQADAQQRCTGVPDSFCGLFPQLQRKMDTAPTTYFPAPSPLHLCAGPIEVARIPGNVASTTVDNGVWIRGRVWIEVRSPTSAISDFAPETFPENQVSPRKVRPASALGNR